MMEVVAVYPSLLFTAVPSTLAVPARPFTVKFGLFNHKPPVSGIVYDPVPVNKPLSMVNIPEILKVPFIIFKND